MNVLPHPEPLRGQVALVTGGAHRLGGALSLGLAAAGADVVVNYASAVDAAADTVDQMRQLGRRAEAIQADLGEGAAARRLAAEAVARMGRLDIVVHSASPFEPARFDQVTEAIWDHALDVTLKAGFFLAQAAAPALRATGGNIVFISDVAARRPYPSFIPHSAAKAGLENLTLALATALAPEVRVNAVAPGVVLPPDHWDDEQLARAAKATLVGHIGAPRDIVAAVVFLLTSPYITGQTITVDGGRRSNLAG